MDKNTNADFPCFINLDFRHVKEAVKAESFAQVLPWFLDADTVAGSFLLALFSDPENTTLHWWAWAREMNHPFSG